MAKKNVTAKKTKIAKKKKAIAKKQRATKVANNSIPIADLVYKIATEEQFIKYKTSVLKPVMIKVKGHKDQAILDVKNVTLLVCELVAEMHKVGFVQEGHFTKVFNQMMEQGKIPLKLTGKRV